MADLEDNTRFGTPADEDKRPSASPHAAADDDSNMEEEAEEEHISLTIHHHGVPHEVSLPRSSALQDLSAHLESHLSVPIENQKLLISGAGAGGGLQKPPFAPTPLSSFPLSSPKFKINLLGSTSNEIAHLNDEITSSRAAQTRRANRNYPVKPARPTPTSSSRSNTNNNISSSSSSSQYTFHKLLPLSYLPHPERSLSFLARLRDDRGIAAAMRKHQFSVPLLTEMDPAPHTTESGRTLGLNRNRGEVIELRLRTDAYDGYRDYRTIRKTLCHELAHCVHGPHDAEFYKLMREIERDVEKGDYWGKEKGRRLTEQEFYNPGDWEEMEGRGDEPLDHGGWTGGEFVLGGLQGEGSRRGGDGGRGLSRREILARAAEERMAKEKDKGKQSDGSAS